jgi:hypothetical protein
MSGRHEPVAPSGRQRSSIGAGPQEPLDPPGLHPLEVSFALQTIADSAALQELGGSAGFQLADCGRGAFRAGPPWPSCGALPPDGPKVGGAPYPPGAAPGFAGEPGAAAGPAGEAGAAPEPAGDVGATPEPGGGAGTAPLARPRRSGLVGGSGAYPFTSGVAVVGASQDAESGVLQATVSESPPA